MPPRPRRAPPLSALPPPGPEVCASEVAARLPHPPARLGSRTRGERAPPCVPFGAVRTRLRWVPALLTASCSHVQSPCVGPPLHARRFCRPQYEVGVITPLFQTGSPSPRETVICRGHTTFHSCLTPEQPCTIMSKNPNCTRTGADLYTNR